MIKVYMVNGVGQLKSTLHKADTWTVDSDGILHILTKHQSLIAAYKEWHHVEISEESWDVDL